MHLYHPQSQVFCDLPGPAPHRTCTRRWSPCFQICAVPRWHLWWDEPTWASRECLQQISGHTHKQRKNSYRTDFHTHTRKSNSGNFMQKFELCMCCIPSADSCISETPTSGQYLPTDKCSHGVEMLLKNFFPVPHTHKSNMWQFHAAIWTASSEQSCTALYRNANFVDNICLLISAHVGRRCSSGPVHHCWSRFNSPVQTLLWRSYSPHEQSHTLTPVHTLKIQSTGSHTAVWTHQNTAHTGSTPEDTMRLPKWQGN